MRTWITIVLVSFAFSACIPIPYELVPSGDRLIGDAYTVNSPVDWTKLKQPEFEIWTVDGFSLQSLRLYGSISDGQSLVPADPSAPKKKVPRYREGMEAIDVADLVEATLEIFGATKVAISDIRPAPFGGRDGFRFEVEFVEEGLIYLAAALGSIDDQGRLDLIVYAGTQQHYFELRRDAVDKIFASVRLG